MQLRVSAIALALAGAAGVRAAALPASCAAPSGTYGLIQAGIFEQHGCTQSFCHGAAARGGLDLRAGVSYGDLLQEQQGESADMSSSADELERVVPGKPDQSLLYLKLAASTLGTTGVPGQPMPISGLPLSPDELEGIRLWILAGAPQTGVVSGVADLIDACPPNSQLAAQPVPPPCSPGESDLLLPNLVEDPPTEISVAFHNGHRWLEFTSGVANEGDGPLIVRAAATPTQPGQVLNAVQVITRLDGTQCSRPAGTIRFEGASGHWAYGSFASYELRKDDPLKGDVVAHSSKSAYCLLDTNPLRGSANLPHQFQAHCEDNVGVMGISVGYKDVYDRVYPNQWIDLDSDPAVSIPPATYYLVNIANPNNTLLETDPGSQDDVGYTRVTVRLADPSVPGDISGPAAPRPVPRPHAPAHFHPAPPPRLPAPRRPAPHLHAQSHDPPQHTGTHAPHAPHAPHQPQQHAMVQ